MCHVLQALSNLLDYFIALDKELFDIIFLPLSNYLISGNSYVKENCLNLLSALIENQNNLIIEFYDKL